MGEPSAFDVDVAVVGAGPGGYVAALRAAGHGLSVALVERDRLGGVCANQGCIPTKALLRSAEVLQLARDAASFGVKVDGVSFDFQAMTDRAAATAARMEKNVGALVSAAGIRVIRGSARLLGGGRVAVDGDEGAQLQARHIVLATGARPRVPAGFESDGRVVWTCVDALAPDRRPDSLLVLGAGAIGIEFASFFGALGTEVTVVEAMDRVLPAEDADVSAAMHRALRRRGIRTLPGATASAPARGDGGVTLPVTAAGRSEQLRADALLVATGITANVEGLGLEGTKARVEAGHVVVDEWLRTGEPGLYAIGDLTGAPWLAHKASREAEICIDRIAGVASARPLDRTLVPACTYSMPQVASVGWTEQAALEAGYEVRCGRASFVGNGRARASGDTEGLVKTVFDAGTGELLGAHLVGPEVTEIVPALALARTLEATEAEILATVFPHPTLSEAVHEAARAAFEAPAPVSAAPTRRSGT